MLKSVRILLTVFFAMRCVVPAYCAEETVQGKQDDALSSEQFVPVQIPENQIAARVNQVPITKDELNRATNVLKNAIAQSKQFQGTATQLPMNYIMQLALDVLIANELIFQKAIELGITVTEKEMEEEVLRERAGKSDAEFQQELSLKGAAYKDFYDGVKKSLYVRKVIMKEFPDIESTITQQEIKQRYDVLKNSLERESDMLDISHIVKEMDNEASDEESMRAKEALSQAKKLLEEGAQWNEIATQYSDDKVNPNGNLGFIPLIYFPESMQPILQSAPVGSITDVIEAPDGFHIIKINERHEKGGLLTLPEANNLIKDMIVSERIMQYYEKYINGLKANASIEKLIK
ncbi:peptidylprolyl isomerase [bacterium]|nr:peptidylprolyl isomerase [bacterium]